MLNLSGTSSLNDEPNRSPENAPKHLSRKKLLLWLLLIVFLVWIFSPGVPEAPTPPLDYSKPVYTNGFTIVCPLGLLFDVRADHGPDAIFDLFTSVLNLHSKEEKLGCEEWRGGLRVDAVPMSPPFDQYVQIQGILFTMPAHLTNALPGSSANQN